MSTVHTKVHTDGSCPPQEDGPQERALAERVKELNCLYSISRLFEEHALSLEEILKSAVKPIPLAWQHPDIAAACITLDDSMYTSDGYSESQWTQSTPIIARGTHVGRLDVVYLEERPEQDEGPFLTEERCLLNLLAQRLGELVERKDAERQLGVYREQLRSLAVELTRSDELVRREFARELHDGIGQQLALTQIRLGMLVDEVQRPEVLQQVAVIRQVVAQMIKQTRTLIFEISPPVLYEQGLEAALEWLTEQASTRYNLPVVYEVKGVGTGLAEELRAVLYRAAAELLANVGRHASATQAWLTLDYMRGETRILVRDDGVGFDVVSARERAAKCGTFGLFSIRVRLEELGGDVTIDSEPGFGTRISLKLPTPEETTDGATLRRRGDEP